MPHPASASGTWGKPVLPLNPPASSSPSHRPPPHPQGMYDKADQLQGVVEAERQQLRFKVKTPVA
jgi:hypothetical protein